MTMPYVMKGPIEIATSKLLLWPNNPRLKVSDFSEVKFNERQLLDDKNQKKIFDLLAKHEDHDVASLVVSMTKNGFMREKAPVVMKVRNADRYLVLEGNRRLTAIRTIRRSNTSNISTINRRSLESIPCWLFEHTSKVIPLKAAISRMVAEAHIKGQRPHTKLQRAHMLYDAYEGFLTSTVKSETFSLNDIALTATAEFFDLPALELERELSVVRLYKQFVEAYEFEDIPKKCSERLSWVHKNQRQFASHFGYDPKHLCFDEEGLDRYYDVFLHPEAAVYNPQTFKLFLTVMRYGGPEDIEAIRCEPEMLGDIEKRIREERSDSRFLIGLEGVEKRLNALRISDFNNTNEEVDAINRIVGIVENKLCRLRSTGDNTEDTSVASSRRFKKPRDIQEALSVDYAHLSRQVVKVVKARPNSSCVREKIPTYLLKEWGIKSRGRPREAFCEHIDRALEFMIDQGLIVSYTAKNNRVRV